MLTFLLLIFIVVVIGIGIALFVGTSGVVVFLIFGDVIVGGLIVFAIIKTIIRR